MRLPVFYGLLFIFLLSGYFSEAQNSILAGKIVDENNNPLPGAILKLTHLGRTIAVTADEDGLYYSPLLEAGNYRIDISARDRQYKAPKVYLEATEKNTKYYNYTITKYHVIARVEDRDPFMETELSKVEADKDIIMEGKPGSIRFFKIDTTGKIRNVQWPAEKIPTGR